MAPDGAVSTPSNGADARIAELLAAVKAGKPVHELDLAGITVTGDQLRKEDAPDFSGADLRGATFANVDLSSTAFVGADLSGAAFHNVNLMRSAFRGCSGRGTIFTDVNLAYADFAESDLRGALFFDANMADISFKGAALEGMEADAIRLSLNGATHVLGLKEALRSLAGEDSFAYISGASGDCFWLAYFLFAQELSWDGLAPYVLERGFRNFGFDCQNVDEVEEADAWERLQQALAQGKTVVTPLHTTEKTVLGTGFGGAEWVFVSGIDRGELMVSCMLGDRMRFSPQRFRRNWCTHHPMEEAAADLPIVYAMCIVGDRVEQPSRAEITRAGLAAGIDALTIESTDKVAFGFDAYRVLTEDLQSNRTPEDLAPDEARRFLPWLGLGVLHFHGSRWAVRDYLGEILERGDLQGSDRTATAEAQELYSGVCGDLQRFLELMPWSFDLPDEAERRAAFARYHEQRGQAADLLRAAAAKERDALARFQAIVGVE
jgi:hypothetical protein